MGLSGLEGESHVGRVDLLGKVIDARAQGTTAYLLNPEALWTCDIADPTSPTLIGVVALPEPAEGLAVAGALAAVIGGPEGSLFAVDLSDLAAPRLAGEFTDVGDPGGVALYGSSAAVANRNSTSLPIVDLSNPDAPQSTASVSLAASPDFLFSEGPLGVAITDGPRDVVVFDFSSPGAPVGLGSAAISIFPHTGAVAGGLAFIEGDDSSFAGAEIFSIAEPGGPQFLGAYNSGPGGPSWRSVAASGHHMLLLGSGLLRVIDVSDPAAPELVADLPFPDDIGNARIEADLMLLPLGASGIEFRAGSGVFVSDVIAHLLGRSADSDGLDINGDGRIDVADVIALALEEAAASAP